MKLTVKVRKLKYELILKDKGRSERGVRGCLPLQQVFLVSKLQIW